MPTANEVYQDRIISHQIGLRRLSNATLQRVVALLNETRPRVRTLIVERMDRIAESGVNMGPETLRRLEALDQEVAGVLRESHEAIASRIARDMESLASYEVDFQARLMNDVLPVRLEYIRPSPEQLRAIVYSQPFQGRVLRDWTAKFATDDRARIMKEVRIAAAMGETPTQTARRVEGTKALRYRDGKRRASRRELQMLVQTASSHIQNRARQKWAESTGVVRQEVYVATLDSKTTFQCASLDGQVFPAGQGPTPPVHMNCLPGDSLVSTGSAITGVSKRWFDGDLVVIRTAGNRKLSITPNHPVLTQRGWVGAQFVDDRDQVVYGAGVERKPLPGDDQNQEMEARIKDVSESFLASGEVVPVPMPVSAPDFHGDGVNGDVAVVATNRFLRDAGQASRGESALQMNLDRAAVRFAPLSSFGALDLFRQGVLTSSRRFVGLLGKSLALAFRGARHAHCLLLGSVAKVNAATLKSRANRARGAAELLRYSPDANSSLVKPHRLVGVNFNDWVFGFSSRDAMLVKNSFDDFVRHPERPGCGFDRPVRTKGLDDLRLGDLGSLPPALDAGQAEALVREREADAELARHILGGHSGEVQLDDVVGIDRVRFVGHVYNLECDEPWYMAGGIIVHNCRSARAPVFDGKLVGERPSNAVRGSDLDGLKGDARKAKIRELVGQVPAETTFDQWLSRQSSSFIDDYLGKNRAELYRSGKVTLKDLVDRNGQPWTLEQLAAREGVALPAAA